MAINNTKPLTAIERIPFIDHIRLVASINTIDQAADRESDIPTQKSMKEGVEALGFLHDLYHEVMSNDC